MKNQEIPLTKLTWKMRSGCKSMEALELLEQLMDCGVSVTVDLNELVLRPASKIPPELLDDVRQNKAEIIQELLLPYDYGSMSAHLARLQAGHIWLVDQHQRWQSGEAAAASDAEFSRVWNGWWELDRRLRSDHGFQGCIYSPEGTCPEGFPCQGCSVALAPSVAAQLALIHR